MGAYLRKNQADHETFAVARSEAMNAYAYLEQGQLDLLTHLLDVTAAQAEAIYYNVHSNGDREKMLKTLLRLKYKSRFEKWFKSHCELVSDLSLERNKIVRWTVTNAVIAENDLQPVLAPSDYQSRPINKWHLLTLESVQEFTTRCRWVDLRLKGFVMGIVERTVDEKDYQTRLAYPAQPA